MRYQWLCRAADQGHPSAQYEVGRLLQTGEEIRTNVISAYVWYRLAEENGNTNGGDSAAELLRIMTEEQAEKAERLISEWRPGQCKRDLILDTTGS
jgi:TPR repeat protein